MRKLHLTDVAAVTAAANFWQELRDSPEELDQDSPLGYNLCEMYECRPLPGRDKDSNDGPYLPECPISIATGLTLCLGLDTEGNVSSLASPDHATPGRRRAAAALVASDLRAIEAQVTALLLAQNTTED